MKLEMNIAKKHLYYLVGLLVFVFIAAIAIAQTTSAPNPGHAADEIGEGTIANTLTILGGNVGIGTTGPSGNLHIKGASFNSAGIDYGFLFDPVGGLASGGIAIGKTTVGTIPVIQTFYNANLALLPNGGNVGIGTTDPQKKLHVAGDIGINANQVLQGHVTSPGYGNTIELYNGATGNMNFVIDTPLAASAFTFMGQDVSSGYVGIGTTSPAKNLHIAGGAATGIRLEDTGFQNWDIVATHSSTAGRLDFLRSDGATNVMSIVEVSGGGNIGIGTTAPNSKLQIGTPGAAGREYLQIDMESNAPDSTDCDAQNEGGRMVYDNYNNRIYICDGQEGWRYASTTP